MRRSRLHVTLAVHKLWRRRSLSMPAWELTQAVLGFLIPFWLVVHVIGTRGTHELFGVDDSYAYVLNALWPQGAWRQSLMLILVWLHGCIGIHFWLRLRPWYRSVQPWLFALALLLPTLALIGFANAGRELRAIAATDPGWLARLTVHGRTRPIRPRGAWVYDTERRVLLGFAAVLLGTLGARAVRALRARYGGRVRLRYPDGVTLSIEPGMSVLEASRAAGVPHASVCGGRGRCSTCRVRLGAGAEHLPPPAPDEARVLARIGASADVRLACQLRPTHDLAVVPLLPASASPHDVRVQVNPGLGIEREVAVLFADLRAFTRMSEGRLPYDVVFLLNQYFKAMGQAVEAEGGRVDKFIGDGIMALFGVDADPEAACRHALAAARAMAVALEELNRGAGPRSARAVPHRHRPARGTGDPRRDGLPAGDLAHRGRRHGQRRGAPGGAGEGVRCPAGRLDPPGRARRRRSRRVRGAPYRDPRPPASAAGAPDRRRPRVADRSHADRGRPDPGLAGELRPARAAGRALVTSPTDALDE